MNFDIQILGTASAMPISDRNPSAQALKVRGRLFLIDCGEGMQQRMRQCHLSFLKVEALCISHIHGDHLFGVFGLLSTMAMYGRTEKLLVFAPASFGPVLKFFLSFFGEGVGYEIEHHVLDCKGPEKVYENNSVALTAFPLKHKIDCYGFRFDEKCQGGKSRSYAYCSDTVYFPELNDWVKGVSLLYHEATYTKDMADKAVERFHSTTHDAARCALEAGVGKLVIGHYSSRQRDIYVFERECREIFPETYAANDGDCFEIEYIRNDEKQ